MRLKFWNTWLWWRIHLKKKAIRAEERIIDAELEQRAEEGSVTISSQEYGRLEVELTHLRQVRLRYWAGMLRIHISREPKEKWQRMVAGHRLLTEDAARAIREQIFQRFIVIAGIIFGLSSLVQTVYTVLPYYYPTH
jgi:hypothetical protein